MIEYRTVQAEGVFETEIKKSRFICHITRVYDEEAAQAYIAAVRDSMPKANHHPFAYQLGETDAIQRMSDDGEPSGTAGVPILETLQHMDLHNVVAVVTRFFGGKKLGAGGLIRAYSNACSEGAHVAGVVERRIQHPVAVTIPYSYTGAVEHWIETNPYTLLDTEYLADVTYTLGVPAAEVESVQTAFNDLTSGDAQFDIGEAQYVDVPVDPDGE